MIEQNQTISIFPDRDAFILKFVEITRLTTEVLLKEFFFKVINEYQIKFRIKYFDFRKRDIIAPELDDKLNSMCKMGLISIDAFNNHVTLTERGKGFAGFIELFPGEQNFLVKFINTLE